MCWMGILTIKKNEVVIEICVVGLGDGWGQHVMPVRPREKELGSQILQVQCRSTISYYSSSMTA